MILFRRPTVPNCLKGTTFITFSEMKMIADGTITEIHVTDESLDKVFELNAKDCVKALFEPIRMGTYEQYMCFNYKMLSSKPDNSKTTLKVMTQDQVADFLGVDANRVCELHRFNFLTPFCRDGKSLLYLESDVQKASQESRVIFWKNSFKIKVVLSNVNNYNDLNLERISE